MAKSDRFRWFAAFATTALLVTSAWTADHRDAPGVNEDPRADINDIYAFVNPNSGNVVLAMTVNPFQIGGGPGIAFGQDVLYEFKIDNDGDNVEDLVVQTTFTPTSAPPQRFNVRGPARPRLAGTASSLLLEAAPVISGTADGTVVTQGSGNVLKAFAGQRDDPFFFDLIFGFRLLGISPGGPLTRAPGIDFFAGINVSIIALELPPSALRGRAGDVLRIWGTTGRPKTTVRSGSTYLADTSSGPYVQIDRMAIPVENTVLMPTRLKDAFNRSVPAQDHLFREEAILHLVAINGDRTYSQTLVDAVLFPDVLTLDLARGSAGFINGRRPQDDVIDTVLQAASKGILSGDGVNANDVPFLSDFPFFAPPHDPTRPIPAREKTGNVAPSAAPDYGFNLIRRASLPDTLSRATLGRRAAFPPSLKLWPTRGAWPTGARSFGAPIDPEIAFWSARIERDQDDHISATKLGYAYLKQARKTGDFRFYGQAESALTEALKRSPGHYTAILGLATARAARHRFRDALALAQEAAARQAQDADAFTIIGDAYLGMGDLAAAESAYKEVASRAPGFATDTRMANLLHARGKSRDAVALLRQALDEATARDLPVESRSWCRVIIGATLFDLGDWTAAEPEYQAALALTPDSYVAIEHLAELRAYQRRDREALALYERAIAVAAHPDFFEAVARVHERSGRPQEAKRWHRRARDGYLAAVKAGDPGYYRHLALFYTDVEPKPREAVSWARKDLELRQDAAAWSVLAWALLAAGDTAGARDANARAIASGAEDAPMWFRAGMIEKAAGRSAAARAAFTRALAINPKFDRAAEARKYLGTGE